MSTQPVELGTPSAARKLTKDDFASDQDVRWCPGCGDYAVLAAVQRFLPTLDIPQENFVFVSGIGCSSRFPYYMNTYGFHTIHGRAPAVATGVKLANPDLSVWLVTGDGDAFSIGGNHIIHLLRRNPNINVLLFNNRIYGLTKGQYSPTSELGKVTKSSPGGSVDHPINPLLLALGAEASFVARTVDVEAAHMGEVLRRAAAHNGTSFIEIFQNCNIFNDGAWQAITDRPVKAENQLLLTHGKPLIFGKEKNKGIKITSFKPEIVTFEAGSEEAAIAAGVVVYDEQNVDLATILARLKFPEFPVPLGVVYAKERPTFDQLIWAKEEDAKRKLPLSDSADMNLNTVFRSADTWEA